MCPNPGGFGAEFYSDGSRVELLIRIRVCAGPTLLSSGLRRVLDEVQGYQIVTFTFSLEHPPVCEGYSSTQELKDIVMYILEEKPGP